MKHIKFLILSSVSMFLFASVAFVADVFAANPHFTPMSLLPQPFASASGIKVAGIYWLPDYLKGNVSRGNDDPDKILLMKIARKTTIFIQLVLRLKFLPAKSMLLTS